jgi:NAD(P)-dependent dehydrogenase (short-subunit alcohol dehydrogenase family)
VPNLRSVAPASDLNSPAVSTFENTSELPDTILSITAEGFDRHFRINARAPVLLTGEMARRAQAHGLASGRIINISTNTAQSFATQIAYGASKAALEAFTRSTAIELGPLGITVNAIAPGPVQTGWIKQELEEQLLPWIPLGRVGTPEDIADAVCFFASDQARWITGQVLAVSGGHVLQARSRNRPLCSERAVPLSGTGSELLDTATRTNTTLSGFHLGSRNELTVAPAA